MYSMQEKKLNEDIKKLEEKMFGSKEGVATSAPPEESSGTDAEAKAPQGTELVAQNQGPKADGRNHTGAENWELRYKNLRASRDTKLYEATTALGIAQAQITQLQQQLEELEKNVRTTASAKDPLEGILTQEDRDALGETAIAAMRKTAQAISDSETRSIKEQLEAAKAEAKARAASEVEVTRQRAYDVFLSRLASIVPDFASLDVDPSFISYMQELDIDGVPRANNFALAEKRGDAGTVARYMIDYKEAQGKQKAPQSLENKLTPTGTGAQASAVREEDPGLTMGEIKEHYNKHARGYYKGRQKEFQEMEARIAKAATANRIKG